MKNPKANDDFLSLINKEKNFEKSELQFNGFYEYNKNKKDKEFYTQSPVIFFKNGIVFWLDALIADSTWYSKNLSGMANEKYGQRNWGTFEMKNDTVNAIIFCQYNKNNDQIFKYELSYYQGVVMGRNKIVNWRMIEPFPKLNENFNKNIIRGQSTPTTLFFKNFPAKTRVDSNGVWINDYRNKEVKK